MSNLDLVNWTMHEAGLLGHPHQPQDEIKDFSALESLLEILEGVKPKPGRLASDGIIPSADSGTFSSPGLKVANGVGPIPASDLTVPARTEPTAPISALLKAIVEPDLLKDHPADRNRAIALRWVLRDIKSNRLELSPVDRQDLQELIDMGLVEIRDGIPVLTNAGVSAII